MGEIIRHTGTEIKERWMGKMPRFFRLIVVLCACIVGTAFGINQIMVIGGATPHQWWTDIYPLLLGVPTGMAIICKLTVAGGYKNIDPDRLMHGNMILDKNIDHMDEEGPCDIEPYDDGPNA